MLLQIPKTGIFTPESLRACIRANFAAQSDASLEQQGESLDNVSTANA